MRSGATEEGDFVLVKEGRGLAGSWHACSVQGILYNSSWGSPTPAGQQGARCKIRFDACLLSECTLQGPQRSPLHASFSGVSLQETGDQMKAPRTEWRRCGSVTHQKEGWEEGVGSWGLDC